MDSNLVPTSGRRGGGCSPRRVPAPGHRTSRQPRGIVALMQCPQAHCLGGEDVGVKASLYPGEHRGLEASGELVRARQNEAASGPRRVLVVVPVTMSARGRGGGGLASGRAIRFPQRQSPRHRELPRPKSRIRRRAPAVTVRCCRGNHALCFPKTASLALRLREMSFSNSNAQLVLAFEVGPHSGANCRTAGAPRQKGTPFEQLDSTRT